MTNKFELKKRNKLKYFIGNWKMFGDHNSFKIIKRIQQFYVKFRKSNKKNKVILCVPNTLISFYKKKLNSKIILLGAQKVDYIEILDLKNLKKPKGNKFNLFFAFYIGRIRFIDNF